MNSKKSSKQSAALTKHQRIQAFFDSSKIYPSLQSNTDMNINDDDLSEFY